jgi:hypothetical protein
MYKQISSIFTFFFCVICILLTTSSLFARDYFVSTNGKNSNIGSISSPFRTIQFAVNKLQPGDKCFIREGVYREYISLKKSGKKNLPIEIRAYNNEKVTLAPPVISSQWKHFKKGIYRTPFAKEVIQLFIQDKPYMQASFPSIEEGSMQTSKWADVEAFASKEVIVEGCSTFKDLSNTHLLALCGRGLISLNGRVSKQEGNKLTIDNQAFFWEEKFKTGYLGKGKGFLVGSIDFLDSPGEWFWDGTFLYLMPRDKKDLNGNTIAVRTKLHAIDLRDQKWITIAGITIQGGAMDASNTFSCDFDKLTISYITPFFKFGVGFDRYGGNTKEFGNLDNPINWSGKGFCISGKNNKISNSKLSKSWGDGLTVWGENNTVFNCQISDCDWIGTDCAALNVSGKNHIIKQNSLFKTGRSVLLFRKFKKGKITNNHIYSGGLLCDDLGLMYCYDTNGENSEIAYNWLHDNKAPFFGCGLYLDNHHKNFIVHHNVIWDCFVGLSVNSPCSNVILANNMIFNVKYAMGNYNPNPYSPPFDNLETYNNITNTNLKAAVHKPFYGTVKFNNVIEPKLFKEFKNIAQLNFKVKSNSSLIDKGSIGKIPFSYSGKKPDIGAYEYGEEPWIPGYKETNDTNFNFSFLFQVYIYPILVFILFCFLSVRLSNKLQLSKALLFVGFLAKISFGFLLYWIYTYYYPNRATADIFKYYDDAKIIYDNVFSSSSSEYFRWLWDSSYRSTSIQEALSYTEYWNRKSEIPALNDTHFLIRVHGFLNVITFGNYYLHGLFFTFLSFVASSFLFKILLFHFQNSTKSIFFVCFLLPSTLFFSSGLLRETFLTTAISILIFVLFHFSTVARLRKIIYVCIGVFSFYILLLLKPFVAIACIPTIGFLILHRFFKKQLFVFMFVHLIFYTSIFFNPFYDLFSALQFKLNDLNLVASEMHANSAITIPLLIDKTSLLTNLPSVFHSIFLAPSFSLSNSIFSMYFTFENWVLLLLFLLFLFFPKKLSNPQKTLLFSLFSIGLGVILFIGWTVPIVGSIVRYKSIVWNLFFCIPLVGIDFSKLKDRFKRK